ncbi:cation-translocating P-type ATPase [Persephonella sp. KM09-Lau-8]|uniref:heavy metal translocating P-type ATPase n=1 Tax=Persephonella sp. KM09-Lau-8 TaxID=1158345 RepID=UPI000494DD74|nr:cation-translocating P-type ATPase [Persephonella sp. KM09-Lau-8]
MAKEDKSPKITFECECTTPIHEAKECYQCGIPITGKPVTYKVDGEYRDFCCFGCYLIYKTTGMRGEEGTAVAFLGKFGFGYFFAMLVFMLSTYMYGAHLTPDDPEAQAFVGFIKYVILILATPVMLLLGIPILRNAFSGGRINLNTDTLIVLGSFSAYFLSVYSVFTNKPTIYFETATMILVLMTFGRYIETSSRAKASNFMKELLKLSPEKAVVIRDGQEIEINRDEIKVGDVVKIIPGEKIPADGVVIEGQGHVDESLLTGETKPVFKKVGDELYTGTTNIDGSFKIKVNKPAEDWTLNRFIQIMKEIRATKAPINRIADTIAYYFLPVIVTIATAAGIYWYLHEGFEKALIVFMSVLLISCPCAFSIGAPLALWIGLSEAMREGIIIKGADILEKLSTVKTVFFDKTGTITERNMVVSYVKALDENIVKLACCLERNSEHPLAKSFVSYCVQKGLVSDCKVEDFRVHFGFGVEGIVDGVHIYIGSKAYMEKLGLNIPEELAQVEKGAEKNGEIVVFIATDEKVAGVITFAQKIRKEAPKVIQVLKKLKINVGVLTGDTPYFAKVLKEKLGIENIKAGLMPEDKLKAIQEEKSKGRTVAMVGDGINDAPALTQADIGIAMGCGTDLTRESANISLLSDDLRKVPLSILLAKKVRKVIYTNIFWAFIYNIIGIGLAVSGKLSPIFAALAMVLSSAFVIANSIRVKNW